MSVTSKTQGTSASLNAEDGGDPSKKAPMNSTSRETGIAPRFLVVKRTDGDFMKVNPFIIEKSLYNLIGAAKGVNKIKDGLLVQVSSAAQSRRLQQIKTLGEFHVEVVPHTSLNVSRGVIYCPDLLNCTLEEILDGMKEQGVIAVRRIKTKRDGILVDSPNHVLTFNNPVLPKRVKVAFYSLQVRIYIPPPMRCFKCQRFGHTSLKCDKEQLCVCGKPLHVGNPCEEPLTCVNCNGMHSARSRNCPVFKEETAIQELKTKENISYMEAKKRIQVPTPTPNISYAKAVRSPPRFEHAMLIDELVPKIIAALSPLLRQETLKQRDNISEKRKRDQSTDQASPSSGDETSMSSQVTDSGTKPKIKKRGWPRGKPRKVPSD